MYNMHMLYYYTMVLQREGNFTLLWTIVMEVSYYIYASPFKDAFIWVLPLGDLYKKINDQKGKLFTEDQVSGLFQIKHII